LAAYRRARVVATTVGDGQTFPLAYNTALLTFGAGQPPVRDA
jgi:hypothetical protein